MVVAADGYPGSYGRGIPVRELPALEGAEAAAGVVFHASTLSTPGTAPGKTAVTTNGGRCFAATGVAATLPEAVACAYQLAGAVRFEGAWHRSDIGHRFLDS